MREAGDLGDILVAQGTYSQDWMLYPTDWNWRVDPKVSGPSRVMGDIGSHWFDMIEHLTGLRVKSLCADLQTFHPTRKKPKRSVETFTGKLPALKMWMTTLLPQKISARSFFTWEIKPEVV